MPTAARLWGRLSLVAGFSPLRIFFVASITGTRTIGGMSTVSVKNLLNVKEAAELIGITEGRVCQLARDGSLRGEKLNERAWAIYRESAVEYRDRPQTVGRPRISA